MPSSLFVYVTVIDAAINDQCATLPASANASVTAVSLVNDVNNDNDFIQTPLLPPRHR